MNFNSSFQSKEYQARLENLCVQYKFDVRFVTTNTKVRFIHDEVLGTVTIQMLRKLAAGDTVEEYHSIEYPSNWWEHLKDRWSPKWALKRWPVKMKTVKLPAKVTRMCPHLKVEDNVSHMRWLVREPVHIR